jgi:hypothetical protein
MTIARLTLPPFLLAALTLAGCAANDTERRGPLAAYHDTRLQYAILTDDRATLKQDFQVNPDRSPLERGLTAVTLPFAAATETAFWPVFYGLTYNVAEQERAAAKSGPSKSPSQ